MDFQSIIKYNSDSNGQQERFDLGKQEKFDKNIPLSIAIERRAPLISRTSYISEEKPGAWYINIKRRIEENVELGKYSKRICYMIDFFFSLIYFLTGWITHTMIDLLRYI
jgi:hypothetical protein